MKKLITIILLAIVSANTYGQYVTPVGTAQWFKKEAYFGTDTTHANMVIRTNGNVGIGTSSPLYNLDILGMIHQYQDDGFGNTIEVTSTTNVFNINKTYSDGSSTQFILSGLGGVIGGITTTSVSNNSLGFATNGDRFSVAPSNILTGSEYFTVLSNGYVGIGEANPTETFNVKGSIATKYSNGGHDYIFLSNSLGLGLGVQNSSNGNFESQAVVDPNYVLLNNSIGNSTTRSFFTICEEDDLLLGFGDTELHILNTIRFDTLTKYSVGINTSPYSPNMIWTDSSYTPKASIYNNGYMKLGSSSAPQQTLDVAGSAKIDSSLIIHGEYYTQTDSVFSIPNNITTVIIDPDHSFVSSIITMPDNPYNGQIVTIVDGENDLGALTLAPFPGQTIVHPPVTLHNTSVTYRYRLLNHTWYRW